MGCLLSFFATRQNPTAYDRFTSAISPYPLPFGYPQNPPKSPRLLRVWELRGIAGLTILQLSLPAP